MLCRKEQNAEGAAQEPNKEKITEDRVRQLQADEIKRDQEADAIIRTLESLSTKSPQATIDSVYLEAKLRAAIVNDDNKQSSYMDRIKKNNW